MDPVAGITVFDGMLRLVGVRSARPPARKGIPPVEPAHRLSSRDHLDLSSDARAAAHGHSSAKVAHAAGSIGRLIDVLA
ncbi:MAG: hypothetical protein ACYS15_02925 [Planctomycetota bacterium]|jgi:hypothetical protein